VKIAAVGAVAIIVAMAGSARADDVQSAYAAVNVLLQQEGGGLVARQALCPPGHDNTVEWAASATVVEINETDRAILVDSGHCNGGNGSGQYLVVLQGGAARVVTDAGINDMSFLASNMYLDGDVLTLYGNRWLKADPHCCPSKKATLQYNFKTHRHKLTITGNNKL
jgi:hypothetical protein